MSQMIEFDSNCSIKLQGSLYILLTVNSNNPSSCYVNSCLCSICLHAHKGKPRTKYRPYRQMQAFLYISTFLFHFHWHHQKCFNDHCHLLSSPSTYLVHWLPFSVMSSCCGNNSWGSMLKMAKLGLFQTEAQNCHIWGRVWPHARTWRNSPRHPLGWFIPQISFSKWLRRWEQYQETIMLVWTFAHWENVQTLGGKKMKRKKK